MCRLLCCAVIDKLEFGLRMVGDWKNVPCVVWTGSVIGWRLFVRLGRDKQMDDRRSAPSYIHQLPS